MQTRSRMYRAGIRGGKKEKKGGGGGAYPSATEVSRKRLYFRLSFRAPGFLCTLPYMDFCGRRYTPLIILQCRKKQKQEQQQQKKSLRPSRRLPAAGTCALEVRMTAARDATKQTVTRNMGMIYKLCPHCQLPRCTFRRRRRTGSACATCVRARVCIHKGRSDVSFQPHWTLLDWIDFFPIKYSCQCRVESSSLHQ